MRNALSATALLLLASLCTMAAPASAQSTKMRAQDCPGSMHGDTCEMNSDQYDAYTRHRDWNENVRRNEEARVQRAQLDAEARARYNQRSSLGAAEVMRRRRAAAAAAGN